MVARQLSLDDLATDGGGRLFAATLVGSVWTIDVVLDLREKNACVKAVVGAGAVYNLAADMGGIGFIEGNKALCMLSVLINTHLVMAAHEASVEHYMYASSACVYAAGKQSCSRSIVTS